jgi:hypothetical protein
MRRWVVVFQTAEPDSELIKVVGPFMNLREAEECAAYNNNPKDDEYTAVMELTEPGLP